MKISKTKPHTISFAKKLESLEEIYHHIQQSEDTDIENIISLYERGMSLAKSLESDIQSYELKIQEIQSSEYDPDTSKDTNEDENNTEQTKTTRTRKKVKSSPTQNIELFDE